MRKYINPQVDRLLKERSRETPIKLGVGIEFGLTIVGATVILTNGSDQCSLQTRLPSPYVAEFDTHELELTFHVTRDLGTEYIRQVFEIEPHIIDVRNG